MKSAVIKSVLTIAALCCIIAALLTCTVFASTLPSVEVSEQDKVIVKEAGQTTFDAKTLFEINPGSYNIEDLSVAYSLTKDGEGVQHDDLVFAFKDGKYSLTVMVAKGGEFSPVLKTVNFELKSVAPEFEDADSMQNIKTINVQKNQGFIDLRILYDVIGNSYSEEEYKVSFDAKYPGRTVEIFGYFIKSISGVYTITVKLSSVDGSFEDVVSVPMTVIVQKAQPQVVFEYENETGMTTIGEEHTIYIYAGSQYVDLNEYFTVYGNAYVANEYSASLLVKRMVGEDEYVNCQVFDGSIAPIEGEYKITVKVDPKIQGAFTPITSRTVTFYIVKAVPKVTTTSVYVNKANEDGNIVLSDYISVSNSAYSNDSYEILYEFMKDGKPVAETKGNTVELKNGEYTVKATITSLDGAFEPQVSEFVMTVELTPDIVPIIVGCVCGGVALAAIVAVIVVIAVKKSRGKKECTEE